MPSDGAVSKAILLGHLPVKETPEYDGPDAELKGNIWSLCCRCWIKDPKERPSMQGVLRELIRMKYRYAVGLDDP